MGNLRFGLTLFAGLALAGCGAAGAAPDGRDARIEPVLVQPRVPVEAVGDRLGAVQTSNADRILAWLDAEAQPGTLPAARRAEIGQAGDTRCWSLDFHDAQKVVYVRRRGAHWWAAALPVGEGGRPVPPLTWMGAAITVNRAELDEQSAWYRELSRRVATSGRASGIAIDEDGGATGITVELRLMPDEGDAQLVVRALRMQAAQFDAAAWGPALHHTWGATAVSINGREGVAICDLLSMRPY